MLRNRQVSYERAKARGVQLVRTARRRGVKKQQTATGRLADFLNNSHTLGREKILQKKVLRELKPLLPRKDEEVKTDTVEFYLGRLQAEINRMNLRPFWVITPAQIGRRPEQRVCEILGTRWVVGKRPFAFTREQEVYLDIISSLESGEFSRLRRCSECRVFFVATHGATTYCTPECQKAHDQKAAPERMRKSRAERAKEKLAESDAKSEANSHATFCRFWELFNKRRNTTDEGREMHPILEGLGRGDAARGREVVGQWQRLGASSREIWNNLTPSQKKVFYPI